MQELGVPLSRSEMRKIKGGTEACFECSSAQNPTLDTFYCSTMQECLDRVQAACEGQTNCSCHAG
jgi:hypothetical protein